MQQILKTYQRRLLNLSSSNRSLLLLRPSQSLHFDLHELDYLHPDSSFSIIKNLLSAKTSSLLPVSDSRHAPNYKLSRRLLQINRKAKLIWEERGGKELYVGWPFVHGSLADNTMVRGPLIFFPVSLNINAKQVWELQPDANRQPHFNKSFLLAYAYYLQQTPDENLLDLDVSELPSEAVRFRSELYELLKKSSLEINFNQDLFTDKLCPFSSFRKEEFEKAWKPGQLKLFPEAVLGVFPQAASYLLSDYEALVQQPELKSVESLFDVPGAGEVKNVREQQVYSVLEMDASQEAALLAAKQGKSLLVQGPPGTGKSQLICNLAADFMARGKKVLIVCQKRAALDVVHKRLASKGLGDFSGLVHDIHADRKPIFSQINNQIYSVEVYRKQHLDFGNIYIDRQFQQTCKQIDLITEKLSKFKAALFDDSVCGWSVKELYLRSDLLGQSINFSSVYQQITAENMAEVSQHIQQALQYRQWLKEADFWQDRRSLANFTVHDQQEMQQVLKRFPTEISEFAQKITTAELSLPDSWKLLKNLVSEDKNLGKTLANLTDLRTKAFFERFSEKQVKIALLVSSVKKLKQFLKQHHFPKFISSAQDLAKISQVLTIYHQKEESLVRKLNWNFFSGHKKQLQILLTQNELNYSLQDIKTLQTRIENKQKAWQQLTDIFERLSLPVPGYQTPPEELISELESLQLALETADYFRKLQKKYPELLIKNAENVVTVSAIEQLVETVSGFKVQQEIWLKKFTAQQLDQLSSSPVAANESLTQLNRFFEYLVAADIGNLKLTATERTVLKKLVSENTTPEKAVSMFQNSIFLAWITHIEQLHPDLRIVSNGQMELLEEQLQNLISTKQNLSQQIVQLRVQEQTYKQLEFNRLGNLVTYRKLQAQVQKRRQLYPLRKLFQSFHPELFNLIPCWLASPDTVSALFPLIPLFDLVIFDEASQCFSEQGLPAIFRGRQTVIAGDSKQLRPSDLYRVRWQQEEEEEEELAAESLLDLGSFYLRSYMLTEHYRSRFPELIAFSNKHFYQQKLQLIPDKENLEKAEPAIQYFQVQGLWENNTNLPEAEFVVEKTISLIKDNFSDIGIITFNYNQQQLIQDLLESAAQQNQITIPDSVFVKNIENIQGDEKQVIILSPGYAPDVNGKFRLQFGSLNTEQGENRLNVAVTRAISKIIVVSSLQPEQLSVENTRHNGPKLLKQYLTFARTVSAGNFKPEPASLPQPAHGFMLKNMLSEKVNHKTKTEILKELPFADLTVKKDTNYKKVILTDDDQYFQERSVKHIHAGLPYRLEVHHWPYKRIYSRQWWQNSSQVLESLN